MKRIFIIFKKPFSTQELTADYSKNFKPISKIKYEMRIVFEFSKNPKH